MQLELVSFNSNNIPFFIITNKQVLYFLKKSSTINYALLNNINSERLAQQLLKLDILKDWRDVRALSTRCSA